MRLMASESRNNELKFEQCIFDKFNSVKYMSIDNSTPLLQKKAIDEYGGIEANKQFK